MGVIRLLGVITPVGLPRRDYYPHNTEAPKRKAPFIGGFLFFILGTFPAI